MDYENNWDSQTTISDFVPQDLHLDSQEFKELIEGYSLEQLPLSEDTADLHGHLNNGAMFIAENEHLKMEQKVLVKVELPLWLNEAPSTSTLPTLDEFEGKFKFTATQNETHGQSWIYSELLDQVFIDMGKVLMVDFNMKYFLTHDNLPLFVRAVAIYPNPDDLKDPVNRCIIHSLNEDPNSIAHKNGICLCSEMKWVGHVVRTDVDGAIYCYNRTSMRHSILVPMPTLTQADASLRIPFRFMCKTSCAKGMMRRPIRLVFTLEAGYDFQVLGRKSILVKICSCPKRDRERQEKDFRIFETGQNGSECNESHSNKKRVRSSLPSHHAPQPKMGKTVANTVEVITQQHISNLIVPNPRANSLETLSKQVQTGIDKCKKMQQDLNSVLEMFRGIENYIKTIK